MLRKKPSIFRMDSHGDREEISPSQPGEAVEYFFASDASAIIEHTNRVIFLEDDDVAAVAKGNSAENVIFNKKSNVRKTVVLK
jgi:glucosamine 6-phosphate synthetase-like amidotransferase/phosphosugar isomerase protein